MEEAADILPLELLLPMLSEEVLDALVDDGELLEVLEVADRALQRHQPHLEDVIRSLDLDVQRLLDGVLTKFVMSTIEIHKNSLLTFVVVLQVVDVVRVQVRVVVEQPHPQVDRAVLREQNLRRGNAAKIHLSPGVKQLEVLDEAEEDLPDD